MEESVTAKPEHSNVTRIIDEISLIRKRKNNV